MDGLGTTDAGAETTRVWVSASGAEAEGVGALLPPFVGERDLLLALHLRGPAVPWQPALPGVVRVVRALERAQVPLGWTTFGRAPCPAMCRALAHVDGVATSAAPVGVRLRSTAAVARIPAAWFGRHLLVMAPCVLRWPDGGLADGPLGRLCRALAVACEVRGWEDAAVAGAEIASIAFAGVTVLVDAATVVVRGPHPGPKTRAAGVDRNFVMSLVPSTAEGVRRCGDAFDRWCVDRLAGAQATSGISLGGPASHEPWPMAGLESVRAYDWAQAGRSSRPR